MDGYPRLKMNTLRIFKDIDALAGKNEQEKTEERLNIFQIELSEKG